LTKVPRFGSFKPGPIRTIALTMFRRTANSSDSSLLEALNEMCRNLGGVHLGRVECTGCEKTFTRHYDFRRHWRVGVPCQFCDTYVVRGDNDKWKSFLSHHKTMHSFPSNDIEEQNLLVYFKGTL
jgi:hypothetical protein